MNKGEMSESELIFL